VVAWVKVPDKKKRELRRLSGRALSRWKQGTLSTDAMLLVMTLIGTAYEAVATNDEETAARTTARLKELLE
jgi:hypothetical protein